LSIWLTEQEKTVTMKLYTDITTLPFAAFVDCKVNQYHYGLIIEGNPSTEVLQTVWATINQQYADVEEEEAFYQKVAIVLVHNQIRNTAAAEYLKLLKQDIARDPSNKVVQEKLGPVKMKVNELLNVHLSFGPECSTMYNAELKHAEELIAKHIEDWNVSTSLFLPIKKVYDGSGSKKSTKYYINMLKLAGYSVYGKVVNSVITTYEACDLIRQANIRYTELQSQFQK